MRKFESTGNGAIDLCMNIIYAARQHNMPLKALHLNKAHYEWFIGGVHVLMGRELEPGELPMLDGVNIEKGETFQTKPVVAEYYEDKPIIAQA